MHPGGRSITELFGKPGFPSDNGPFQKRDVGFWGYSGSRILQPRGQLLTLVV